MRDISNINPEKIGLVLVDLQKGYCDPASDCAAQLGWDVSAADQLCHNLVPFLEAVRKLLPAQQIIWMQMEEDAGTFAANAAYGSNTKNFTPLCVRGTSGHDFHIVAPAADEPVFLKFHPSAFHCQDFRDHLQANGIAQLAFIGVISSRCVNASIIPASALGYECVAISDYISGPAQLADEMKAHEKVTGFFYAQQTTADEFLRLLAASGPATAPV